MSVNILRLIGMFLYPTVRIDELWIKRKGNKTFLFTYKLCWSFITYSFWAPIAKQRGSRSPNKSVTTYPPIRGCLHGTGATFAPERVHSGSLSWLYICTVVVMSCLVNMSSDVMWYAGQSGHAIYRGSRGIGMEKNLHCGLVCGSGTIVIFVLQG